MAMPTLTYAEVLARVLEELNLSKDVSYGNFDGSPLYKQESIRDTIFHADDFLVQCIFSTPGHPRRPFYSNTVSFLTEGILQTFNLNADSRGGAVYVEVERHDTKVVPAETAPASKIAEWVNNKTLYGGDDCVDGYYNITDGFFIFSGAAATVWFLDTAKHQASDTNLFSPPEYEGLIVNLAVGLLMLKDPAKEARAQVYLQNAQTQLSMNVNSQLSISPLFTEDQKNR